MENNLYDKAKFFAQYYKQKVMRCYTPTSVSEIMYVDPIAAGNHEYFLELTPLSQISDEDALWVAHEVYIEDYIKRTSKDILIESGKRAIGLNFFNKIKRVDYFRSKGYALPWMGISVEEQIKRGWIKIKEL